MASAWAAAVEGIKVEAGLSGTRRRTVECETESHMRSFEYLADGRHVDDAGNLICCAYVDFRVK